MARSKNRSQGNAAGRRRKAYIPPDRDVFAQAAERYRTAARQISSDGYLAAVAQVSVEDVRWGMTRLNLQDRVEVLMWLGIRNVAPKQLPRSLCATILKRLPRDHDARHAAHQLGLPAWTGPGSCDALACLVLWAVTEFTATDYDTATNVRAVLEGAEKDWWLPYGITESSCAELLAAAQAVVDASPDFVSSVPAPAEPESAEDQADGEEQADDGQDDAPPLLEDLAAHLQQAWDRAREVPAVLDEGLDAGDVPDPAMYAPLEALASAAAHAADVLNLSDRQLPTVPALLEALTQAQRQQRLDHLRTELAALGQITGPVGRRRELAELSSLQSRLLAAEVWDEQESRWADGLIALYNLVDLINDHGGLPSNMDTVTGLNDRIHALPSTIGFLSSDAFTGTLQHRPLPEQPVSAQGSAPAPAQSTSPAAEPPAEVSVPAQHAPEAPAPVHQQATRALPAQDTGGKTQGLLPVETPSEDPASQPVAAEVPSDIGQLASMIEQRRFSAAHALATGLDRPDDELWCYRIAALADAVRSAHGPCGIRLSEEFSTRTQVEPSPLTLTLAIPALVRAALVTGSPGAGALLSEASRHTDPAITAPLEAVAQYALEGKLIPLIEVLSDVNDLERRLEIASADARERLERPRRMSSSRATDIVRAWFKPDSGVLGKLLIVAADDDRDSRRWVAEEIDRLSDLDEIRKEIDKADHNRRANAAKPLDGGTRRRLMSLATGTVAAVANWSQAAQTLDQHRSTGHHKTVSGDITAMRRMLLSSRDVILAAFTASAESPDPVVAAAAKTAFVVFEETFALLEGRISLQPGEPAPEFVITRAQLKVPTARYDADSESVAISPSVTAQALADALDKSWAQAFEDHVATENYQAAEVILAMVGKGEFTRGPLPDLAEAGAALTTAMSRSRREIIDLRDALRTDLQRARGQNELSEEEDARLLAALQEADHDRHDLDEVRAQLQTIAQRLPEYRKAAADKLRARLDRWLMDTSAAGDDTDRVSALIDQGQLSIAEELLYCLESNESIPEWTPSSNLPDFFPTVADALTGGITRHVLTAVGEGKVVAALPDLDFGALGDQERARAAASLTSWTDLAASFESAPAKQIAWEGLRGPLRLVGLEVDQQTFGRSRLQGGKDRRFLELPGVEVQGSAIVPAFGVRRNGRLRILAVSGNPGAKLLMSWIDQDQSSDPVLVVHFGTMRTAVRQETAVLAVASQKPIMILDDAALLFLAARGTGLFDTTVETLLPFSAVNPYLREKRGEVAPEMFYGRDRERRDIIAPDGTQVIYGGRGLGKSALLKSCETRFQSGDKQRVAIYLDLRDIVTANGVWDMLRTALTQREVLQSVRAKASFGGSQDVVRAGVEEWLREDTRNHLLILLDEADAFFESDTDEFRHTVGLKKLGSGSHGRVKVVFAGLHSVQRFAKIGNNGPFQQLALRPAAIGPLTHQGAFELVAKPLCALGMTFATPDLVHRINGHCGYQPFLLQMFCHHLVEHMQQRRLREHTGPPYVITEADVEAVESDHKLRNDRGQVFRDTLILDPRYNVIANVLAFHSREPGLAASMTQRDLFSYCRSVWPEGFDIDQEVFRTYLKEMVGLGVLADNEDGHGWHLRSVNILAMIGTDEEVLEELASDKRRVPHRDHMLQARWPLPDGTRSPLTVEQLDDLLGDYSTKVSVVLGSQATGIGDAVPAVLARIKQLGYRYRPVPATSKRVFEEALVTGVPGDRNVVVTDLPARRTRPAACIESLDHALNRRPTQAGVTRSVIMAADPTQLPFWEKALREEDAGHSIVALRRHTAMTLEVWTMVTDTFTGRADDLLHVTSGWPYLVEQAHAFRRDTNEEQALARLAETLSGPAGAYAFLTKTGLLSDPRLLKVAQALAQWGELPYPELNTIAEMSEAHPDPEMAVQLLMTLQVFDLFPDGRYRVDPLLAQQWAKVDN